MTIQELEQTYIDDLNMLDDWMLQYDYLLQISASMPKIPDEYKTEENKVPGCQSGVWLKMHEKCGKIYITADSDALIIRGILSIAVGILNERTPEEIVCYKPRYIEETNIKKQISTDRFQGMNSVIDKIKQYAEDVLSRKKSITAQ